MAGVKHRNSCSGLFKRLKILHLPFEYIFQLTNLIVIFLIGIVGGGVQLGPLGTATTNGLLCQPRVIMMMEKLVE
jgi:hypothetical protein